MINTAICNHGVLAQVRTPAGILACVGLLSACGGGGGGGNSQPPNQLPVANAGPDQTVLEQRNVILAGAATDADGTVNGFAWVQQSGTPVILVNANAASASFTSPSLSTQATLAFRLTATDNSGGQGTDTITVVVDRDPALNNPPNANPGSPQQVGVQEGVTLQGGASTDNESDGTIAAHAWTQLGGGPAVTLTNANAAAATFTSPTVAAPTLLTFNLLVTDNEGLTSAGTVGVTVFPPGPPAGKVTYDKIPFGGQGLDYNGILNAPIRGAVVEAININDRTTILASTTSDQNGDYALPGVPAASSFFIRVKAQLLDMGAPPNWNFRVLNNTNGDALYALESPDFTANGVPRNVRAASGWGGTSYTGTRAAAAFSMLDVAYEMKQLVLTGDANAVFPPNNINWSPSNRSSATFDPVAGDIGTTSFRSAGPGGTSNIYVLGVQNVDTDEYDHHVIAHELGHYFQDAFSRDESIGGPHGGVDRLDMRVAFSEGWGNAFSGMVKNDPRYRDSFGNQQATDFDIDVESDTIASPGWYRELSMALVLYDLFDAVADGADAVSLGFGPIFQAMSALRTTDPLTSIFPFVPAVKAASPVNDAAITAVVNGQGMSGATMTELGLNETNNGGEAANLPIYRPASVGAAAQSVCVSVVNTDDHNKLGNRRFLRFNNSATRTLTIRAAALPPADPDFHLFRRGFIFEGVDDSSATGVEQKVTPVLPPGDYILEVYDFRAVDSDPSSTPTCVDVTINP